ncbi:hypothetical protein ACROYT_G024797 [Oculina patagonica]
MELTSSKLRLASSVSSDIGFKGSGGLKKRQIILIVVFIGLVSASGGFLLGYFIKRNKTNNEGGSPGNGKDDQRNQLNDSKFFSLFEKEVSTSELRENLRFFSQKPHLAGLERQRELAEILAQKWRDYGFDDVELPSYKVLLSYPVEDNPNVISVVADNGTIVKNITEQITVSSGPGIKNTSLFTPYTAYSRNGTAEGKLVYINQGTEKDFEELKRRNISVNGTILLSRNYFGFFATAKMAASKGVKGLLMYPDPQTYAPDGLGQNSTYPNSPWLSSEAVPLAGIYGEFGDPLSKKFPSQEGIYYKAVKDWADILPILLQPISYGTARFLLEQVGGDEIPPKWLKDLNLTLGFKPDSQKRNRTIKLSINNQMARRTIYNVIGTITGRLEPDRYVFLGNHRDAWIYGAADASTGTSVLAETSRVLGLLLKQGWRPRRTIKLCNFGGEEFGLIGSVEWMEENSLIFKERGVSYLNTDVPVQGNYVLLAQTGPLLGDVIYKWTKMVKVPVEDGKYESMYDVMLKRGPKPSTPGEPKLWPYQFASDYIPFYFMAGIPSADFSYFFGFDEKKGGWQLYPSYHTQEDTFYWVEKFADPKFEIHRAMTLLMGGMLLDLADSRIVPLSVSRLNSSLHQAYSGIISYKTPLINETFVLNGISAVDRSLRKFSKACGSFESAVTKVNTGAKEKSLSLQLLNHQLAQVGKAFIDSRVLSPNPIVFQHVVTGDKFSGVLEAFKTNDTSKIQEQLSIVSVAISTAAKILEPIRIPSET